MTKCRLILVRPMKPLLVLATVLLLAGCSYKRDSETLHSADQVVGYTRERGEHVVASTIASWRGVHLACLFRHAGGSVSSLRAGIRA
jgi:hypothetical protein